MQLIGFRFTYHLIDILKLDIKLYFLNNFLQVTKNLFESRGAKHHTLDYNLSHLSVINWILLIVLQIWQRLNHLLDSFLLIDQMTNRGKHRKEIIEAQLS
jgi:hypothetical protein